MASFDGTPTLEYWLDETVSRPPLGPEEMAKLVEILEPCRESIEEALRGYDEQDEETRQSWRDFRNSLWDHVPEDLDAQVTSLLDAFNDARAGAEGQSEADYHMELWESILPGCYAHHDEFEPKTLYRVVELAKRAGQCQAHLEPIEINPVTLYPHRQVKSKKSRWEPLVRFVNDWHYCHVVWNEDLLPPQLSGKELAERHRHWNRRLKGRLAWGGRDEIPWIVRSVVYDQSGTFTVQLYELPTKGVKQGRDALLEVPLPRFIEHWEAVLPELSPQWARECHDFYRRQRDALANRAEEVNVNGTLRRSYWSHALEGKEVWPHGAPPGEKTYTVRSVVSADDSDGSRGISILLNVSMDPKLRTPKDKNFIVTDLDPFLNAWTWAGRDRSLEPRRRDVD